MDVRFKDLQKKLPLNASKIIQLSQSILQYEGVDEASLSIVFVSRQRIKALNKKFLHRDYVTDVLAFDLSDDIPLGDPQKQEKEMLTGEIIISTDAVLKNVKVYQTVATEELCLYIIHGILHLIGFDDHDPKDIAKMRRREKKILNHFDHLLPGVLGPMSSKRSAIQ